MSNSITPNNREILSAKSTITGRPEYLTSTGGVLNVSGGGGGSTNVDVLSVIPGTGATNLGKAEDSPHTSGDVGVFALAVRNDLGLNLTNADMDYSPIAVDPAGRIQLGNSSALIGQISVASSVLPTGAATAAKQDTGNASLAQLETARYIEGASTASNLGGFLIYGTDYDSQTTRTPQISPTGIVSVDGSSVTQPISGVIQIEQSNPGVSNNVTVSASALPTGAATAALQTQPGVDIGDVTVNNAAGAAAVNIQDGGNSITVDGSVTANAGTNLNTSALALESGGNLAAAAASLSVLDDWDESDRAKTNPIVGQAGIAGGVGATGANTVRIVEANGAGRTLVSAGGSVASSGNNTLIAAGTNKLKVYAFSLTTTSTTAVTCIFQSGASGTELWRVVLQAISGANVGANLSVPVPSYLFATGSATLLNLNLSSAQTVHWSCAYYDEA